MSDSPDDFSVSQPDTVPDVFSASDFSLPPRDRIAFYLAIALFTVISAVVTTIIADWLLHRPGEPGLSGLKPDEQKVAIENFKMVSDVVWDRTSRTFDLIVSKALLPVFATIVGYFLGTRK